VREEQADELLVVLGRIAAALEAIVPPRVTVRTEDIPDDFLIRTFAAIRDRAVAKEDLSGLAGMAKP